MTSGVRVLVCKKNDCILPLQFEIMTIYEEPFCKRRSYSLSVDMLLCKLTPQWPHASRWVCRYQSLFVKTPHFVNILRIYAHGIHIVYET